MEFRRVLFRSQILERREQDVLEVDGQRQHPVEEGGDRRQFVLETIAVAERQSCRRLESPERTALDLAAVEQTVKLAQGVARIPGFQIVLRSEQALARSEEHTSELQSLMRISYAVFCLKKKTH